MIGVYAVGNYQPKEGEVPRNLIHFHPNETEAFEAIKVVGEHPNKAKVIEAYKAKGIKVIDDALRKKEEVKEAEPEAEVVEAEVKPKKRSRKSSED